jgi:hypothetical protein
MKENDRVEFCGPSGQQQYGVLLEIQKFYVVVAGDDGLKYTLSILNVRSC